jgi:hypothetical protein
MNHHHTPTSAPASALVSPAAIARHGRAHRLIGTSIACVVIGGGLAACADEEGSGDVATVTLENFVDPEVTSVMVVDDFDVRVTVDRDAPQSASLRIEDNLIDNTDFWVGADGMLVVGWDEDVDVAPTVRPVITLTVRDFDAVENYADGTVTVTGVDRYDFSLRSRGDGAIDVDGSAVDTDVDVTGDATVDLGGLAAERVDLVNTGDGGLTINATGRVTGQVSADADVTVHGSPDTSQVDEEGEGQLVLA